MNKIILIGRFTRDPDIKYTKESLAITRFTLAVDRRFKKDNEQAADFINCVSFGKTAELIDKYCNKGLKIGVAGRLQTGSYTNKEGQKVYTTEVAIEEIEFLGTKNKENTNNTQEEESFLEVPDGMIPF